MQNYFAIILSYVAYFGQLISRHIFSWPSAFHNSGGGKIFLLYTYPGSYLIHTVLCVQSTPRRWCESSETEHFGVLRCYSMNQVRQHIRKRASSVGLPRLQNLVNVYTSSTNRNDPVYTELPDLIFFIMLIGKIADIFPKKTPWKMYLAWIFKIVWLVVVIELISSYWRVIATCANSYITYIFFSCKCVINELTHTRHNCQSSRTHQYTRRQEVSKMRIHQTFT